MPKVHSPAEYQPGIAAQITLRQRSNSSVLRAEYISSANSAGVTTATDTSTNPASALHSTSSLTIAQLSRNDEKVIQSFTTGHRKELDISPNIKTRNRLTVAGATQFNSKVSLSLNTGEMQEGSFRRHVLE